MLHQCDELMHTSNYTFNYFETFNYSLSACHSNATIYLGLLVNPWCHSVMSHTNRTKMKVGCIMF